MPSPSDSSRGRGSSERDAAATNDRARPFSYCCERRMSANAAWALARRARSYIDGSACATMAGTWRPATSSSRCGRDGFTCTSIANASSASIAATSSAPEIVTSVQWSNRAVVPVTWSGNEAWARMAASGCAAEWIPSRAKRPHTRTDENGATASPSQTSSPSPVASSTPMAKRKGAAPSSSARCISSRSAKGGGVVYSSSGIAHTFTRNRPRTRPCGSMIAAVTSAARLLAGANSATYARPRYLSEGTASSKGSARRDDIVVRRRAVAVAATVVSSPTVDRSSRMAGRRARSSASDHVVTCALVASHTSTATERTRACGPQKGSEASGS
eukprot:Opistho-1_new@102308